MLRNTKDAYGWIAIVLHWSIAALFLGQAGLGLAMVRIADQRRAFELIQLHKSTGFLILGVALIRLGWRLANPRPALPAGMAPAEKAAARASHGLLYLALLALPLTGWALVSVSVLSIPTMPFGLFVMPDLPLAADEQSEALWGTVHRILAWSAIALVALHVAAAFHHQFVRGDNTLRRMLRPDR